MFLTLGFAIIGGMLVGVIIKILAPEQEPFHDQSHWELPEATVQHHEETVPLKTSEEKRTEMVALDIDQ